MPIENGARGVCDGVIKIISFYQYSVDRSDRTMLIITRSLNQARQKRKYRRGIASRDGRFPSCQANFALRLSEPCQRIHEQQDIHPLISKIFGNGCGPPRTVNAHQWRLIGRSGDNNCALQTLGAQCLIDKISDLTPSLTHECYDTNVGLGVSRKHTKQGAFPHARTREESQPLAFT